MEALYKRIAAVSKPMGKVTPNITQVSCQGNIALVHTVEEIGSGATSQLYARSSRRSGSAVPAKVGKLLLLRTVLQCCGFDIVRLLVHRPAP